MAQLQRAEQVWTALGARVLKMSPEAHDATYAAVSHFPHLLAFAAMNGLLGQTRGKEFLSRGGPGFRDFTRIAASDPSIWRDILVANRSEVLSQSRHFREALGRFEALIEAGDAQAVEALVRQASTARANWRMGDTPED